MGMFTKERGAIAFMGRRGTERDQVLDTLRCTLSVHRLAPHNFFCYRKDYFIDPLRKTILSWDFQFNRFPCLGVGIRHSSSSWSY